MKTKPKIKILKLKRGKKMKKTLMYILLIAILLTTACSVTPGKPLEIGDVQATKIAELEAKVSKLEATQTPTAVPTATTVAPTAQQPAPTTIAPTAQPAAVQPTAVQQPVAVVPQVQAYAPFTPDWTGMPAACPSDDAVLEAHDLVGKALKVTHDSVPWESCLTVVELKPEFYGKVDIPLKAGYQYTAALVNQNVYMFWGGDSSISDAPLQWGTSFRWMPAYAASKTGKWATDPCELVTREYRFGRYLRNVNSGRLDVVYFNRVGPYVTLPGNISCSGWTPPALDDFTPSNYLEAAAMLGGLANSNEWTTNGVNWAWKYSKKVPGNGTYCDKEDPCWQTTYNPGIADGYIEIWLDKGTTMCDGKPAPAAGPYKFTAACNPILWDGKHNVDEFSYHPFADK